MGLFRRRRRTADASYLPYAPRHSDSGRAGWAQPALPPQSAPPAEPAVAPQPAQAVEPVGVRLGFADGTEVALDHSHPSAVALKTVADVITRDLS
jgi:hypothetical protein